MGRSTFAMLCADSLMVYGSARLVVTTMRFDGWLSRRYETLVTFHLPNAISYQGDVSVLIPPSACRVMILLFSSQEALAVHARDRHYPGTQRLRY